MADGFNDGGRSQERQDGGRGGDGRFPGGRGPREGASRESGGRDQGGFRIRLSDNELRAARAVQDAFGLRSTVAALGLSIRTVAQLLEEGRLDEVVAQHRAQGGSRPQGEGRGRRSEGRPEGRGERSAPRLNPFARPSRPPAPVAVTETEAAPAEAEPADVVTADVVTSEADAAEVLASAAEPTPAEA